MTVGHVGRLVVEKGVDVLIDAAEPLDVQLVIVGDGPERSRLERRVAAWPPGKAVFTGAVTHQAVPDYLAALDALVLPSRSTTSWAEQFGHVLIEAMAAGVPVAGSASAPFPRWWPTPACSFPNATWRPSVPGCGRFCPTTPCGSASSSAAMAGVAQHYTHEVIAAAQRDVYDWVLAHDL
jgi:Glycosyl transferases group 1